MPLEAGLKIASVIGTQYVQRFVGPAQAVVQSKVTKKLQPGFIAKEAEKVVLVKASAKEQFASMEGRFDPSRDVKYDAFHEDGDFGSPPDIVGPDLGPEKPFPVTLDGRIVQGTGQGTAETGTPTANLADVSDDLLLRLNGIYIGWAAVQTSKKLDGVSHDWHEAIFTVGLSPYAAPRVVAKKVGTVHMIRDFGDTIFFDAKLKLVIMAFLRPVPKPDHPRLAANVAAAVYRDIDIVVASLSREAWQSEMHLERLKDERSQRGILERYVDARAQRSSKTTPTGVVAFVFGDDTRVLGVEYTIY
ncbi:hypothetical protein GGR56DRAFT_684354 [Xylariaceae sp. FL0804]|nr:hypothetical protein GGR56DRAFT_684354 [Xylariaceae sp. FL0804]